MRATTYIKPRKHYTKWKADMKDHIPYGPIYMKCLEKANL